MSDTIWIFLNFLAGFFRIVDVNPVSIDNSLFKIIPSSVCGQGGPAKKIKNVSGSKPDTCFFVFFDRSARPPGGWASTLGDTDPVVGCYGALVYGAIRSTTHPASFNHHHIEPCSYGAFVAHSTAHPTISTITHRITLNLVLIRPVLGCFNQPSDHPSTQLHQTHRILGQWASQ